MALSGNALLSGFSHFIEDYWASTVTANGASDGTTLIDTQLARFGDGLLDDRYVRLTGTTSGLQYVNTRVTSHSGTTVTLLPAYSAQVDVNDTYELHRYDPQRKFKALDDARFELIDVVFKEVHDDSITADGRRFEYPIPSTIRFGPHVVEEEVPLDPDASWNVLKYPRGDSLTNWTAASGVAASIFSRSSVDDIVPRLENDCALLVYTDGGSDGTYTQAISGMNSDFTLAKSAGRTMQAGAWLWSEDSGPVLEIVDDSGASTSTAHNGDGWEFLTVSKTINTRNSSTLSWRVRFPNSGSAAHRRCYLEHRFLAFEALPNLFGGRSAVEVERDDGIKNFWLKGAPVRGHQLRLIGKATLSELGQTIATQATNTMEVDATTAPILYAKAAEILFGKQALTTDSLQSVAARISVEEARLPQLEKQLRYKTRKGRVVGPYAR